MVLIVFLSLRGSSEGWNICCVPGQITYRAGTLATLARCRSRWVYDLQNRSSNYLQVQVSGLGREPRGVSQAAFSSAPSVGTDANCSIQPTPAMITERADYFGNTLHFFTVQEPHTELVVEARSKVMMENTGHSSCRTRRSPGKKWFDCCPRIIARRDLKLTNSDLSRRAFRCGRSLQHMRSNRLPPGGHCWRAFWI